jgi:hypothetical protein
VKKTIKRLEKYRVKTGAMATTEKDGRNGAFFVPCKSSGELLKIIASDGTDWKLSNLSGDPWEHVSVSCKDRCPTWEEMCFVKNLFWDEGETVVQFHPPKSEYVNYHEHVLHLWKQVGVNATLPPSETVGPKALCS